MHNNIIKQKVLVNYIHIYIYHIFFTYEATQSLSPIKELIHARCRKSSAYDLKRLVCIQLTKDTSCTRRIFEWMLLLRKYVTYNKSAENAFV